jgi:flagellar protein FlaJ
MSVEAKVQKLLINCDMDVKAKDFLARIGLFGAGFGLGFGLILLNYAPEYAIPAMFGVFILFEVVVYAMITLAAGKRVSQIEDVLPDFLTMMASNIRSGLTPERSLLVSARKEFGPLAKEIDRAAKSTIVAGVPFTDALLGMTERVQSEMFAKTMRLIVEGVRSGGNLADLLERTSYDIRKSDALRKEIAATVLTYKLFMLAAAGMGAPVLYAVSSFMIGMIADMREKINIGASDSSQVLPMFTGNTAVPPELVFWFSVLAIALTAIFGSLTSGVITKGKESDGFKYVPIILAISMAIFILGKMLLEVVLSEFFSV